MAKMPGAKPVVLELHGVKELVNALNALTPKLENKVLRQALRAAGKPILEQAKRNAPVSNDLKALAQNTTRNAKLAGRTDKQARNAALRAVRSAVKEAKSAGKRYPGQLRDSLKLRAMKRKKGRVGVLVQTRAGDYKGDTFYGAFAEYGTSKWSGKAYIRPAYDTKKAEAEAIIKRQLAIGIERESARLARGKS